MVSSVHPATINRVENVFGQAPVRHGPVNTPPRPPARPQPQPVQDSVTLSSTGDADHDGDLK
jgi:hypothetical protein